MTDEDKPLRRTLPAVPKADQARPVQRTVVAEETSLEEETLRVAPKGDESGKNGGGNAKPVAQSAVSLPAAVSDGVSVPLADAIAQLRRDIQLAQQQAPEGEVLFDLNEIEVEFKMVQTRSGTVGGGFSWGVAKLDAKGSVAQAQHHSVKFKLSVPTVEAEEGAQTKPSGSSVQLSR